VIRIDGVIVGSGSDGGLLDGGQATFPEKIQDQLKEALEDSSVKAILVRVNSPGGSAAASQEIYSSMKRAAKKKPIVATISDVGASGAYYSIAPCRQIVANPSSLVGSIGVFMEIPIYKELYNKLGIKFEIIKEGKYKTLGDPSRELTAEERQILQKQTNIIYRQFIDDVAKARSKRLSNEEVTKLANGLVYTGTEALKLKLIDKIGNYEDALRLAAKLGKIKGEPEVVEYEKPGIVDLIGSLSKIKVNISSDLFKEPYQIKQR